MRLRVLSSLLLSCIAAAAASCIAAPASAQQRLERRSYEVTRFVLQYARESPAQPPEVDLLETVVELYPARGGYIAPRLLAANVPVPLAAIPGGRARFYPSALRAIGRGLIDRLARSDVGGVLVAFPDVEEGTGEDLRGEGDTSLRIKIWTARVGEVTTFADGERFAGESRSDRTDHPAHAWMRERSPVRAGGDRDEPSALHVGAVEDYAHRLSRHPGRQVSAELSPGVLPGTTNVSYRVAENKPWIAYLQYSNTGTEATTRARERFGLVHNQLLGRDDILRLDYVTGNFDEVHAFFGSYEAPIVLGGSLSARLFGSYTEYDASQLGFAGALFRGEQAEAGLELAWNLLQREDFFADLVLGARWTRARADNQGANTDFTDDFLLPRVGVRGQRFTDTASAYLEAGIETNLAGVIGTESDPDVLAQLGRNGLDDEFTVVRWNGFLSFYLEPVLNRAAWQDPGTPGSSTLAHEAFLSTKGQWAPFDDRLVPTEEQVVGGLYTVRGYEQALDASDTVAIGTIEYRLHLPRLLYPDAQPERYPVIGEFRTRPQFIYGRPDWDLVFRAFADAARVVPSDPLPAEKKATLFSLGAGLELQLLRHLSVRYDIGFAATDSLDTKKWSYEHHVVATLSF